VAKIIVSSKNAVKVNSALLGFQRMFPEELFEAEGISVPSGVSDQPMSDDETFRGAMNRVLAAKAAVQSDYYVGLEGGVEDLGEEMRSFAWIVVAAADGRMGKAKSGHFYLPKKVGELIRSGVELGKADDIVFGESNSKQSHGAVGILTGDVITRTSLYEHAVILALIALKNPHLF
jgi:inosine/xanthosine triphosphatase